jgi:hypothetical protein
MSFSWMGRHFLTSGALLVLILILMCLMFRIESMDFASGSVDEEVRDRPMVGEVQVLLRIVLEASCFFATGR